MTATEAPVADPAPFVAALRSYAEDGLVPSSRPGHKRGQGRRASLRALLGEGVFDRDVWLNTGDQVHICGPDDPTLDRVAVVDGA